MVTSRLSDDSVDYRKDDKALLIVSLWDYLWKWLALVNFIQLCLAIFSHLALMEVMQPSWIFR